MSDEICGNCAGNGTCYECQQAEVARLRARVAELEGAISTWVNAAEAERVPSVLLGAQTRGAYATLRALASPSETRPAGTCSCGGITQAPGEWAWEGGVLHTVSVCTLHALPVWEVPPCRDGRAAPSAPSEPEGTP